MVPYLHLEGSARFLREAEPDLAEPDDAEDGVVRVMCRSGNVLICGVEGGGVAGAGGEEGPGHGAVGGEDEEDGGVGDGLGAGGGGVAIYDTWGVSEFPLQH